MPEASRPDAAADRLESWKDIAAFLGREVRTVQGWEKSEGLPIHRHQHSRQGSVYAYKTELQAWRQSRTVAPEAEPPLIEPPPQAPTANKKIAFWAAAGFAALGGLALLVWYGVWNKRPTEPAPGVPSSVAVLPFVDMSAAKDQEYFSDGLTEEIIDSLSRVPNLHVVARTSAFAYKNKNNDIRKIASQLNVDAVLEGSVRKSGEDVRITAQLNRASDGFHYWSRTYDRPLRDIFAVQREISQAIAVQLRAGDVTRRQPTKDLEAYRFYQEGRHYFSQFTPESFLKAIESYQHAVARDSHFALAYAGMADAYAYQAEFSIVAPNSVMNKAREAALKAVELDPSSGEAHTALGLVRLDYEWDRPQAEKEFQEAERLNPSSSWAHHWLGHLYEAQGKLDDAIREMQTAMALDPLSEPLYWDLAWELTIAKRYREGLALLDKGDDLFPGSPNLLGVRIRLLSELDDPVPLTNALNRLKSYSLNKDIEPMVLGMTAFGWAKQSSKGEAERTLEALEDLRGKRYIDGINTMNICVALQDRACLAKWMLRAAEEHSTMFVYIPLYFGQDVVRYPEARQLLKKIR